MAPIAGGALNQTKDRIEDPSPLPFSHPPLLVVLPQLDHDAHDPDPDRGLLGCAVTGDIPSGQHLAVRRVCGHGLQPQDPGR